MSKIKCDTVVIGAGPAGYVCAIRLAQNGQKVVCVEQAEIGGTCLSVGCIPSKALISAGHFLDSLKNGATMGITTAEPDVDIGKLIAWKNKVVERLTGGIGMLFKARGVELLSGTAKLAGPGKVEVTTAKGKVSVSTANVVIATGSEPSPIPGFEFGAKIWSSTEALSPKTLPKKILIIGGGVIGMELGSFYQHLGTEVTVVEYMDQIIPGVEPDIVKVVHRRAKKAGIKIHTKAAAKGWREHGDGVIVEVEVNGKLKEFAADLILLTVGRRPLLPEGLDSVGLSPDQRGFLPTDEHCATACAGVWAIGDICHGPMLAHKGSAEGLVAAAAICGKPGGNWDYQVVPGVIFTDPEIATVGMTEAQAKEAKIEVKTGSFSFAANGRALSIHAAEGMCKVVTRADNDAIIGVHMVGPSVTDMISEAALAIEAGMTAEDITLTIHPHPTLSEVFMEACEDVHGSCIHAAK